MRGNRMKKLVTLAIALAMVAVFAPSAPAADSKNPYGTSVVDPAGPMEIILSISKGKAKADFTLSRLQKIKSKTVTIYEPFLKKRQTFTVIPMKTLFAFVGISGKDKVATKALNDYVYTNTAEQFIAADGYIAVKRNGVDIPYDQGGPIRIIFPDSSKWAKFLDAWNWSLASISVR
jgi:hypothetical protein